MPRGSLTCPRWGLYLRLNDRFSPQLFVCVRVRAHKREANGLNWHGLARCHSQECQVGGAEGSTKQTECVKVDKMRVCVCVCHKSAVAVIGVKAVIIIFLCGDT